MMELKVIGGGCDECDRLYENVSEALKRLEMSAQIERVSELIDIVKLGVMTAPSLMKDGKLIVSGQVPSVEKLMELLKDSQFVFFEKTDLPFSRRRSV